MSGVELFLDAAMCFLWVLTYTLALIGTVRYQYPLIAPMTPMVIAPLEFSCLILLCKLNAFRWDYASVAYLYWVLIEIAIIVVLIKNGYIKKEWRGLYVETLLVLVAIMVVVVAVKEQMLLANYVNTTTGVALWLVYFIRSKEYPLTMLTWTVFVVKCVADILAFLVYYADGDWVVFVLSILLPLIDFSFLAIAAVRKIQRKQLVAAVGEASSVPETTEIDA